MKILIVDDEKEFAAFLKDRLDLKGHSVDVAYDGKQAMEAIKLNGYEIVLLDHNMPEATGVEVIKYAKANNIKSKLVVITGYKESSEYFMRYIGADEYLTKPVQIKDVEEIIDKYSK